MKRTKVAIVVLIICMAAMSGLLHAEDSIGEFSQLTLDGKTIKSERLKGKPMVINVGSHW